MPGAQPIAARALRGTLPFAVAALLPVLAGPASAQDCLRLDCGPGKECSIRPARLTARMPAGFAITSIRGHSAIATRGDAGSAACQPVQQLPRPLSLDQASLYGSVQIAGRLQVPGTLRFEPHDGGALEFRPARAALHGTGPFFRAHFERIKLDAAQPPVAITPPRRLAKADCWQAQATAELSDFSVLVGDTSAAGTYPHRARITAVHGFTACTWGGP